MDDDVRSLSAAEVREYIRILDREIEMLICQRRSTDARGPAEAERPTAARLLSEAIPGRHPTGGDLTLRALAGEIEEASG